MRNATTESPQSSSLQSRAFYRRGSLDLIAIVLAMASICPPTWGQTSSAPDSSKGKESTVPPTPATPSGNQSADAKRAIHIVPFGPAREAPKRNATSQGLVEYWGGPVISNVHVVQVMWGSFIDAPSTTGLEQFYTDVTQSNYYDLLAEYGTVNLTGQHGEPGSNQLIGHGVFDGKFTITPSLCPGAATNPPTCNLTDAQIQSELVAQVNAQHTFLPGCTSTLMVSQAARLAVFALTTPTCRSIFSQNFRTESSPTSARRAGAP